MSKDQAKREPRVLLDEVDYDGDPIGRSVSWRRLILPSLLFLQFPLALVIGVIAYVVGPPIAGMFLFLVVMGLAFMAEMALIPSPVQQAIRLRLFRRRHPTVPLPRHRDVDDPRWPITDDGERQRYIAWTDSDDRVPGRLQRSALEPGVAVRRLVAWLAFAVVLIVLVPIALGRTEWAVSHRGAEQLAQWTVLGATPFVLRGIWIRRRAPATAALLRRVRRAHPRALVLLVVVDGADLAAWTGTPRRTKQHRGVLCLTPAGVELWSSGRRPLSLAGPATDARLEDLCWMPLAEYTGLVDERGTLWFHVYCWSGSEHAFGDLKESSRAWARTQLGRDPWASGLPSHAARTAREEQIRRLAVVALGWDRPTGLATLLGQLVLPVFAILFPLALGTAQILSLVGDPPVEATRIYGMIAGVIAVAWWVTALRWWASSQTPAIRIILKRRRLERRHPGSRILVLSLRDKTWQDLWGRGLPHDWVQQTTLARIDGAGLTLIPWTLARPITFPWATTTMQPLERAGHLPPDREKPNHEPYWSAPTLEIVLGRAAPADGTEDAQTYTFKAEVVAEDVWLHALPTESKREVLAQVQELVSRFDGGRG